MAPPSLQTRERAIAMALDGGRPATDVARELELAPRTVSGWVRAERIRRRGEWWAEQVGLPFDFLTAFGFALTRVRATDWRQLVAVYRAEHVAVLVIFDRIHGAVDVRLYPASELDLPSLAEGRSFVIPLNYLGNLSAAVLIDRSERRKILDGYNRVTDEEVGRALTFWAALVRERAEPFLHGDLALLHAHSRGEYPPPKVKLMVHHKATAHEEAAATEKVRRVFPGTEIVVQRYPQPAPVLDVHGIVGAS